MVTLPGSWSTREPSPPTVLRSAIERTGTGAPVRRRTLHAFIARHPEIWDEGIGEESSADGR